MYQPPKGPVVGTGLVAASAMTTIHYILLVVTLLFTLFVLTRIVRRGLNGLSK
ncbi:hypothetical protein FB459_1032 [Yimella lutea]|uniref:Uncharacterized protein n=1 Tax=Yimella lutea TaxID=587872 RepID=A0A542EED1_9MICO|nr:hypothetical protein [Yimella lutea]TQJ13606.1 hypothetical protein FB459_1032 [Yimella lutea]